MQIDSSDLDYIFQKMGGSLYSLKDRKIFITGGTGFIGKWLLESIIYFNKKSNLNVEVAVLARNVELFKREYPQLAYNSAVNFLKEDIRDFKFPEENFPIIIHAATEANVRMNVENPLLMSDVVVNGTKRILDFARQCKAQKVLFISSGAVYGNQPSDLMAFPEDFTGAPDPMQIGSAYGESKRMAELLCCTYAREYEINITIARCFSFVGPYLSLDKHYAIGNFINDCLNKRDIIISGDGKPKRSYMYAADMIIWLLTILLRGKSGEAYNVGSGSGISIEDLAKKIAGFFPGISVKKLNQLRATDRNQNYIPEVQKAMTEFNLYDVIGLNEAINRTIKFHTA